MPIQIEPQAPTICIRREAFERSQLTRTVIDASLALTADDFRVEGDLITIGPLFGDASTQLIAQLESLGLQYFDDYFELTGNWPEWLSLYAMHRR